VAATALVALTAARRTLALGAFDPAAAPALGTRPRRAEAALLVLLALCTVTAVRGLGNLLAVALVIAPGAAALNCTRRLGPALAASIGLGALAGAAGLIVSFHWRVAAGASVALCAVVLFAATLLLSPRAARA
jgi:ABC-type Mn2+/Zn2+ transport system permease subunit